MIRSGEWRHAIRPVRQCVGEARWCGSRQPRGISRFHRLQRRGGGAGLTQHGRRGAALHGLRSSVGHAQSPDLGRSAHAPAASRHRAPRGGRVAMRTGYKVYDSDTHIGPSADTLEKYLSSRVRELVPDLESRKAPQRRHSAGVPYDSPYPTRFRLGSGAVGGWGADVPRTLGEAKPRATTAGASGRFMGSKAPNLFSDDWDVDGRIRDMDEEGVDVQLLVNNGGPSGHDNREVNIEFMRAQHRFLDDFCGKYPHRLKSMICANASYVEESVAEIKRWSASP